MFGQMLPHEGWICVAKKRDKGFQHVWFEFPEEAETYALQEDKKGHEIYLAQATFKTKENRRQENVLAVRSFWLDIDCGVGKPYDTQGDGAFALKSFCVNANLPLPAVVNSVNGLYAHWILDEDIDPVSWKETACLLKQVCIACDFSSDGSRTADSASVLRPVGTRNKKQEEAKPVHLVAAAKEVSFDSFRSLLEAAATKFQVAILPAPASPSLNQEFLPVYDGPPSNAERIAEKCPQVAYLVQNQAKTDEPLWHALIGLARHCEAGTEWAHEWSKNHPDYTEEATETKLAYLIKRGIGPTTCARFRTLNPTYCEGCSHTVTSPIQLGKVYETAEPTLPVEEKPELPVGFEITEHGLIFKIPDEPVQFYDNELYITALAWDESLGYETATVKHFLPHEGWKEFKFRSSLTNDPKGCLTALADNHVKLVGADRKKAMLVYIESYLAKIQRARKMSQLVCQMGWKDDGRFVLGRNVILSNGEAEPVALAKSVPQSIEAFHTQGDLKPWVDATALFAQSDDMFPLAFAFCAGAFGAPLMKFTGYPGAMVAMLGASGVGKTLVGTWIASTYGEPNRLIMLKDDTKNALIGRLGAYGNLPLYIDEVTNIDPEELSELTYRITQGRDKARLNRNATERTINNQWQTLAVVSSNSSIVDKLSGMKQDASPELNRVLEFSVPQTTQLNRDIATGIYRVITENYGHAGIEYIKYLVAHQAEHQEKIDKIVTLLDAQTGAKNEERYWSAIAGVTLYGAACAQKLGLIRFDVKRLFTWVVETIKEMRVTKKEVVNTALDSLGQMIDDFADHRLIIGKTDTSLVRPRGALFIRIEVDTDFLFISRGKVQEWCTRNHASYTAMKNHLSRIRVLVNANARKVLGSRTEFAGSQQPVWVLDLKHPDMGKYQVALTDEVKVREKIAPHEEDARRADLELMPKARVYKGKPGFQKKEAGIG